jgi:hypothetical protein
MATRAYMSDFKEYLPMPLDLPPEGGEYHWDTKLYRPYCNKGDDKTTYVNDEKVFRDPACLGELDPRWPPNEVSGYGMNCFWIKMGTQYSQNIDCHPSIVDDPVHEVVYCDNRGIWAVGPLLDIYPASVRVPVWGCDEVDAMRPRMAARHMRSPNAMFLDLHAEHVPFSLAKEWSEYWIGTWWSGHPRCWRPDIN